MIISTPGYSQAANLILARNYAQGLAAYLALAERNHSCGSCWWITEHCAPKYPPNAAGCGYTAHIALRNGAFGQYARGLMEGFEIRYHKPGRTAEREQFVIRMLDAVNQAISEATR